MELRNCRHCDGEGEIVANVLVGGDGDECNVYEDCPLCEGTGIMTASALFAESAEREACIADIKALISELPLGDGWTALWMAIEKIALRGQRQGEEA